MAPKTPNSWGCLALVVTPCKTPTCDHSTISPAFLFRNLYLHLHIRHPLPKDGISLSLARYPFSFNTTAARRLIHHHYKIIAYSTIISAEIPYPFSIISKTKQLYPSTYHHPGATFSTLHDRHLDCATGLAWTLIPSRRSVNEYKFQHCAVIGIRIFERFLRIYSSFLPNIVPATSPPPRHPATVPFLSHSDCIQGKYHPRSSSIFASGEAGCIPCNEELGRVATMSLIQPEGEGKASSYPEPLRL